MQYCTTECFSACRIRANTPFKEGVWGKSGLVWGLRPLVEWTSQEHDDEVGGWYCGENSLVAGPKRDVSWDSVAIECIAMDGIAKDTADTLHLVWPTAGSASAMAPCLQMDLQAIPPRTLKTLLSSQR